MIVKLLTEHYLEFLSLTGGCTCSSESTHVEMPHCWKSHALAQIQKESGTFKIYTRPVSCLFEQMGISFFEVASK